MRRTCRSRRLASLVLVAVLPLAWGCPGDGSALVRCGDGFLDALEECDDGNTIDEDGCSSTCEDESGLRPTLTSIQTHIFTPSCTSGCHEVGGIGPMPLDTTSASYLSLVDVVSLELPPLLRVKPGDPDQSYLVWKIEGRDTIVGGQMPLFGTPLSQEEIDAIIEWIERGAAP